MLEINTLVITLWTVALFSAVAMVLSWRKLQGGGAIYLKILSITAALWCITYGFEIASKPLGKNVLVFWHMMAWINIAPLGVLWFLFARGLGGYKTSLRQQMLLFIMPCCTIIAVLSNPWLHLMWLDVEIAGVSLKTENNLFFWVHFVYSYGLYLIGFFAIILRTLQARYSFRAQLSLIALASVLATFFNLWRVLFSKSEFDPSPISFAAMFAVVTYVLTQEHLLNIVPIARDIVVDTISLGIVMLDNQCRIVDANWVFCRIVGIPLASMQTKTVEEIFSDDLLPLREAVCTEASSMAASEAIGKRTQQTSLHLIHLPAGRTLKVYTTPIIEQEAQLPSTFLQRLGTQESKHWHGQVLVLEDVSKQVAQEEALRDAKDKAEAANEAKNNFLTTMGHELRTPLTIIRGYSEVLKAHADTLEPEMLLECAQNIFQANQSLSHLVEDILRYSDSDGDVLELKWQSLDVVQMIEHIRDSKAAQLVNNQNSLELDTLPKRLEIVSDYQKLYYIINQLTDNAIKFTKQGTISVQAELRDKREGLPYKVYPQVKYFWFQVCDTGIGIAEENQEYIFEPFTQEDESTTRVYGGGGIGLALCRRYAKMLGGKLEVSSKQGEGSCFSLILPLEKVAPRRAKL